MYVHRLAGSCSRDSTVRLLRAQVLTSPRVAAFTAQNNHDGVVNHIAQALWVAVVVGVGTLLLIQTQASTMAHSEFFALVFRYFRAAPCAALAAGAASVWRSVKFRPGGRVRQLARARVYTLRHALAVVGGEPEMMQNAIEYMRARSWGNPAVLVNFVLLGMRPQSVVTRDVHQRSQPAQQIRSPLLVRRVQSDQAWRCTAFGHRAGWCSFAFTRSADAVVGRSASALNNAHAVQARCAD